MIHMWQPRVHALEKTMKCLKLVPFTVLFFSLLAQAGTGGPPTEPVEIGNEPQVLFDNYIVDNHWAIKYKREAVTRVFHQAKKHSANPILKGDQPSFLWVVRDEDAGIFRMYYQANFRTSISASEKGRKYRTHIAYAESEDGVHWRKPHLGLFKWHQGHPNNIVIGRHGAPQLESCGPCLLDVPDDSRRGYGYLMLYRAKGRGIGELGGIRVIGSNDGIHWDEDSDTQIAHLHSDHHNTVSYDTRRKAFVMFCRAKHIYRAWGDVMLDTGASRRVARMASDSLWKGWLEQSRPQTVLVPDELDSRTLQFLLRHADAVLGRHLLGLSRAIPHE